jgi:uncharacterized membrane protein YkoI
MTSKSKRILIVAASVAGLGLGGAAIAGAAGGGDDKPITGDALDSASKAALAHTGGGTITETEVEGREADDEKEAGDGYYEVEVKGADGKQVEVNLDRDFKVIGSEADDDGGDEKDEANDD